jgi:hypothetical protein
MPSVLCIKPPALLTLRYIGPEYRAETPPRHGDIVEDPLLHTKDGHHMGSGLIEVAEPHVMISARLDKGFQ